MPIYTYRCSNCGVQFERHQKFEEAPLVKCPECSKNTLRKIYLPVGIVFKGSGFYATDHKSPSGAPRTAQGSKGSEAEKSTSESSSSSEPPKESSSSTTSSDSKE
jgi:putative FmdB family regulatory protein